VIRKVLSREYEQVLKEYGPLWRSIHIAPRRATEQPSIKHTYNYLVSSIAG